MSRFFSEKYRNLTPYTPGEQPRERQYIKLNTNESPFPPTSKALQYAAEEAGNLQLYPDPTCKALHEALAKNLGVEAEEVLCTNGSDEILNFAFMAFCDSKNPALFPEITYGFYEVFAQLNRVPYRAFPLNEDFSVDIWPYCQFVGTVFLANPNAPTGIALTTAQIETILQANPDRVVVIDEAYVEFGGDSCVPLIHKYDNLLVCRTFSKSCSMAGARLGFGVACKALIQDLNTVKYSTNPYNINRMTMGAGMGTLEEYDIVRKNCAEIVKNRDYVTAELEKLGFTLTPSKTNFVFAKHEKIGGEQLYLALKEKGILVRHFSRPEITDYNRITIGTKEQMDALLCAIKTILEEQYA